MIEKELNNVNAEQEFYGTFGTWYGVPYPEVRRLETPITPKENMKRFFQGKDFQWIPDAGCDQVDITPDNIPDVVACGYEGGIDNFGVQWDALENGLPSMVRPGNPMLKDIADWEKLKWPDVSSWDWENYGKKYQETLGNERFKRGVILSGFFERIISLMDFEAAVVAYLVNPEATRVFLDKLADLNIEIVEHYSKYFHVDGIMLHDDWGAQRAPFFSINMVREYLVPPLKRVVDRCHELGLIFTFHSCGNALDLVPAMIEAGVDSWQLQENAVGFEKAVQLYGSDIIIEGYWPVPDVSEAEAKAFIESIVKMAAKNKRGFYSLFDEVGNRTFDIQEYAYSISKKYAKV